MLFCYLYDRQVAKVQTTLCMVTVSTDPSLLTYIKYGSRLRLYLQNMHACLNRGSYMSAHVLLNLLNELGKRDKMRGLPSILALFRNEFNKKSIIQEHEC